MLPSPSQVSVIILSYGFLPCARLLPELEVVGVEMVRGKQGEGMVTLVSSLDSVGNVPPGASQGGSSQEVRPCPRAGQEHSLHHQTCLPRPLHM